MIKKMLSALGFAALFVVGVPTTVYSDSLPGIAARAIGGEVGCFAYFADSPGVFASGTVQNICGRRITVWVPMQSRATGAFIFHATAPQPDLTECRVTLKTFTDGTTFQSENLTLNGRTQLHPVGAIANSSTTIVYTCRLNSLSRLQSVDSRQI